MSEIRPLLIDDIPIVIHRVSPDRPWAWLAAGWRDFRQAQTAALTYGAIVALLSLGLTLGLYQAQMGYLLLPLAAGFMLVGPILATGLYQISRLLDRGRIDSFSDSIDAWRQNPQILGMGVILMLLLLAWVRIAFLIFALFFGATPPSWELLVTGTLLSADGIPFLIVGCLVGGALASLAFAISVVSIPMLLDHDVNAVTAIITSLAVVRENLLVMIGWGALITLFTAAGIALGFLGLMLTYPLLGFASWHAYRDLVTLEDD